MEASIHKRVKSQCRGGPFTRIRKIGGKHLTSWIHTNIDICISIIRQNPRDRGLNDQSLSTRSCACKCCFCSRSSGKLRSFLFTLKNEWFVDEREIQESSITHIEVKVEKQPTDSIKVYKQPTDSILILQTKSDLTLVEERHPDPTLLNSRNRLQLAHRIPLQQ